MVIVIGSPVFQRLFGILHSSLACENQALSSVSLYVKSVLFPWQRLCFILIGRFLHSVKAFPASLKLTTIFEIGDWNFSYLKSPEIFKTLNWFAFVHWCFAS